MSGMPDRLVPPKRTRFGAKDEDYRIRAITISCIHNKFIGVIRMAEIFGNPIISINVRPFYILFTDGLILKYKDDNYTVVKGGVDYLLGLNSMMNHINATFIGWDSIKMCNSIVNSTFKKNFVLH
jgi:hypothetical protein